ncbi:MAG: DNA mismatch repair protein MutS, partial [Acidobacteriota bacterium]
MKQTPMLQQYLELKSHNQDALLLYRLGDFYELFFEDAERAAPVLGIVLTRRRHNEDVEGPMCGIPHHALSSYTGKLLDAGFKVAIAEQLEAAGGGRGLVRRGIVRLLTPGTVTEPELLGDGERRWTAAVVRDGKGIAIAYLEAASGELGGMVCAGAAEARELLLALAPRELLLAESAAELADLWPADLAAPVVTLRPASWFAPRHGDELLRGVLGVGSLRAFELDPGEALVGAGGALMEYLRSTHGELPRHLRSFDRRQRCDGVVLDAATVRNLELLREANGESRGALARVLDQTMTAMGSRLLRDWLLRPLAKATAAAERHEAVAELVEESGKLALLRERLHRLGDLERVAARLGLRQGRPGELAALRAALGEIPALREELQAGRSELLASLGRAMDLLEDLRADLEQVLAETPPALAGPGMVRLGFDAELDEARQLAHGAKEVLGELEARARSQTGIATMKIRYNRVFGYAFEVSNSQLERVPPEFIRRQTLAGGERFITDELVDLERRITTAEGRAEKRERGLFEELVARCAERAARLAATARALASVDVLCAFATRARMARYVRPRLVAGP